MSEPKLAEISEQLRSVKNFRDCLKEESHAMCSVEHASVPKDIQQAVVQLWPSSKAQDEVLGNVIFIPGLSKDTYDDRQAI